MIYLRRLSKKLWNLMEIHMIIFIGQTWQAHSDHFLKSIHKLAYIRAIQLLQTELDQNPANIDLNSRAALYNAKLGRLDVAQSALTHALAQDDLPSIVLYRGVVTFEILSDRSKALIMLGRAIEAEYPFTEIMNDPELKNLRQDPAYHQLLATKGNSL